MENKLIQQNNTNIMERDTLHRNIVQSILTGECTIPEDIAEKYNLSYNEVINLFSDANFISLITKYSQAKMKMTFYGKDLVRLDKIVNSEDNKESLAAIKLKAQLTNTLKNNSVPDVNVGIQFNLENLVKESENKTKIPYPVMDTEFERK